MGWMKTTSHKIPQAWNNSTWSRWILCCRLAEFLQWLSCLVLCDRYVGLRISFRSRGWICQRHDARKGFYIFRSRLKWVLLQMRNKPVLLILNKMDIEVAVRLDASWLLNWGFIKMTMKELDAKIFLKDMCVKHDLAVSLWHVSSIMLSLHTCLSNLFPHSLHICRPKLD